MEDSCKVQHLNRASSDQLLRKFADLDSKPEPKSAKKKEAKEHRKRKRSRTESDRGNGDQSPGRNGSLVELKSLLPPKTRRSALLRQLGIGRQGLRAREIVVSRSLLNKIQKTWRKTVEGASKMFLEKHCHQHMRLRNEVV